MSNLSTWLSLILALLSIVMSLFVNLLTEMWSPSTNIERGLVFIGFVILLVTILSLTYLQTSGNHPRNYVNRLKSLFSPWLIVALCCLLAILSLFFRRDLVFLSAMASLFSASITFYFEKIRDKRFPNKKHKVLLAKPYTHFKPYTPKDDSKS